MKFSLSRRMQNYTMKTLVSGRIIDCSIELGESISEDEHNKPSQQVSSILHAIHNKPSHVVSNHLSIQEEHWRIRFDGGS